MARRGERAELTILSNFRGAPQKSGLRPERACDGGRMAADDDCGRVWSAVTSLLASF